MERYFELTGYWNLVGEYNFTEQRKWQGQIVLNEDGWFEGIAHDLDSSKNTYRMIFGRYNEEDGIYLYKMAPRTLCEPQIISGTKTKDGLDGEIIALSFRGATSIGVSRIITKEIDKEEIPDDFYEQIEEAKERTESTEFYNLLYSKTNANKQLQLVRS